MVSEHLTQWCHYDVLLKQPSLGKGSVFCSSLLFSKKRPTNTRYLRALSKHWKGKWCGRAEAESPLPTAVFVTPGVGAQPLWKGASMCCLHHALRNHYVCFSHQESSSIQGFLVSKFKSFQPLSYKVGPVSHRIWIPHLCPGASLNSTQRKSWASVMPFLPLKQ